MSKATFILGDAAHLPLADQSVDLVFGSPPYEAQRTYSIGFNLRGQDWVDWMVEVFRECQRVSRGLVAMVVEGFTKQYRWSATPALLMADLHRAGFNLRKPPIFNRIGIPGSGGPDWLRNDYEFIVCVAPPGKLPWSDNTAMGHPPKWAPGGAMSYRDADGNRKNIVPRIEKKNGDLVPRTVYRDGPPTQEERRNLGAHRARRNRGYVYVPPEKSNPGNIIKCIVGGGVMAETAFKSELASSNEAPFPESLAEFFVLSFSQPGGTVLDPFSGSGTTCAVAVKHGRNGIGVDIRESQIELGKRRLAEVQPVMF